MLSTSKTTRSRRIAARIAIAGALAVVPLAAVAGPALADTVGAAPSATQVDWRDHGGGPGGGDWHHGGWPGGGGGGDWHHGGWPGGGGGDWHHGDWHHGWPGGGPGPWMPPFLSGSAG